MDLFDRKKLTHIYICMLFLIISGCKKEETVTVSGNNAPVDNTISELKIENYVNKTFISVLGREPQSIELKYYKQEFLTKGFSVDQRKIFIDDVIDIADYRVHLYGINHSAILQNMDTNEYSQFISIYQILLSDTTYYAFWNIIIFEQNRLKALQQFTDPWLNGTKKISDMHRLMVYNYFYDQINMGSLNYVNTVFQQFLKRNPTQYEQTSGVAMVDGQAAILLGKTGATKEDFNDIIFSSADYYEGAVRELFQRFMFREPTNLELSTLTQKYKSQQNYEDIEKEILTMDEFAGI